MRLSRTNISKFCHTSKPIGLGQAPAKEEKRTISIHIARNAELLYIDPVITFRSKHAGFVSVDIDSILDKFAQFLEEHFLDGSPVSYICRLKFEPVECLASLLINMGKTDTVESLNDLSLQLFMEQFLPATSLCFQEKSSLTSYNIGVESPKTISSEDLDACFSLVQMTSKTTYAKSSLGWHPKAKRREMQLPDLKYLLVRQELGPEILGFASFMLTYEDNREVVYLYDIHLREAVRGIGLGKHLITAIQQVGYETRMEKMMLTVFEANSEARTFYERLGFSVDDFSPGPRKLRGGIVKEPDYAILSKVLRAGLPESGNRFAEN